MVYHRGEKRECRVGAVTWGSRVRGGECGRTTLCRCGHAPDGAVGSDEPDGGGVHGLGGPFRGGLSGAHGAVAVRWAATAGAALYDLRDLPATDGGGSAPVPLGLPEDLLP